MPVDFLGQLSTSKDRSLFEFRRPLIIKEVTEESLNKNFNLLQGDVIESINGIEIPYQDQITEILENNKNQTIEVSILRDEMSISKTLNVNQDGALGIIFGSTNKDLIDYNYIELVTNTYDIEESFSVGSKRFTSQVGSYLDQFKAIFSREVDKAYRSGGFITKDVNFSFVLEFSSTCIRCLVSSKKNSIRWVMAKAVQDTKSNWK